MATRRYVSSVRSAAADAKREHVIATAVDLLRREPISAFSLEAAARAAGVTRLTLYNQFGSRRGLLEAAFDHIAARGRLGRIADAITDPSPRRGLEALVDIFCDFWSSDPAIRGLQDAMASDPEFAQALGARNERRRRTFAALVERLPLDEAASARRAQTIDLLFALTSYPMFRLLRDGPSGADPRVLIQQACRDALDRLEGVARP
jgi:AcrR family transcriptional regulator